MSGHQPAGNRVNLSEVHPPQVTVARSALREDPAELRERLTLTHFALQRVRAALVSQDPKAIASAVALIDAFTEGVTNPIIQVDEDFLIHRTELATGRDTKMADSAPRTIPALIDWLNAAWAETAPRQVTEIPLETELLERARSMEAGE